MKTIRLLAFLAALAVLVAPAPAQYNTLSTITLTTAVTDTQTTWTVSSSASLVAPTFGQNGSVLFVGRELVYVQSIQDSTHVVVKRINNGAAHTAGVGMWYGPANLFYVTDPSGSCTASTVYVKPWINTQTGVVWTCSGTGSWGRNDGQWPFARTAVADAPYTVVYSDYIVAFTSLSSTRLVTLPAAATMPGRCIIVKDEYGNATSAPITITSTETTATCAAANYGSCKVCSNGSAWGRY
jgi:hypothetical protein